MLLTLNTNIIRAVGLINEFKTRFYTLEQRQKITDRVF